MPEEVHLETLIDSPPPASTTGISPEQLTAIVSAIIAVCKGLGWAWEKIEALLNKKNLPVPPKPAD